jgi:hypothetical protein
MNSQILAEKIPHSTQPTSPTAVCYEHLVRYSWRPSHRDVHFACALKCTNSLPVVGAHFTMSPDSLSASEVGVSFLQDSSISNSKINEKEYGVKQRMSSFKNESLIVCLMQIIFFILAQLYISVAFDHHRVSKTILQSKVRKVPWMFSRTLFLINYIHYRSNVSEVQPSLFRPPKRCITSARESKCTHMN